MTIRSREQLAKDLYGVSLATLESRPEKALKLSRGIGTNLAIRAAMQKCGFLPSVAAEVWTLLQATSGRVAPGDSLEAFDPEVISAITVLDPHDEIILEVVAASIAPRFPEQASFLAEGLVPTTGMGAVLNVQTLLNRMDALEKSPDRKGTRKKDQAALDLLAERGITPKLRKELAGFIKVATSASVVQPVDEASIQAADEAYVRALGELSAWYDEWSRMARLVVKRRDHLMLLGLAHSKSSKSEPETPDTATNP